ncbi:hypothetical protein E2C01_004731 [Portunus trituberculatus]|uniref:Uncharacterized protein n=1 Tax=Portunus trituberculatus TaxID=210409 RepID=A0A5B7CTS7_PORTR|nr:hypothetical protein [Portunus trituberculatus]
MSSAGPVNSSGAQIASQGLFCISVRSPTDALSSKYILGPATRGTTMTKNILLAWLLTQQEGRVAGRRPTLTRPLPCH